jgi:hypothetical protein
MRQIVPAVALAALMALPTDAKADFARVGRLTCVVSSPDAALHFGSARPMDCSFRQPGRRVQHYGGTLRKYGIEWGVFTRTVMHWDVYSRAGRVRRGGLEGSYGGVTFEAALGSGVGANVVDGGPDGIRLSPVGTQVQTGSFNVTTGAMRFHLKFKR